MEFIEKVAKKLKVDPDAALKTTSGKFGGTFAHWQVALAYAKYLDPKFHIWANQDT